MLLSQFSRKEHSPSRRSLKKKNTTALDCLNKTLYFKECLVLEKLMEK